MHDGWVNTVSRWWERRGLQYRSTAVSVVAVAIALVLIGLGGLFLLRAAIESSLRNAAIVRAEDFAAQFASDADAAIAEIDAEANDGMLLQVFDSSEKTVAASMSLAGRAPLTPFTRDTGRPIVMTVTADMPDQLPYLVAYTGTRGVDGSLTVAAAQSLGERDRVVRIAAYALLLMGPFLLVAVGVATWLSVGRSLRTVDAMRQQVELIEAGNLDERVPVPVAADAIHNLAVTMNQMLGRMQSALTAQRRFVADASHELKSPLAVMTTTIDVGLMTDGQIDRDGADVLAHEVGRMSDLVSDLLLLARSDEGALTSSRDEIDLDDLVTAEARRVRHLTPVAVETSIEATRIIGDRAQIERVLRNLTDNARRFAQSRIRMGVNQPENGVIELTVEDDGPGVPVPQREVIFDRFVRLDQHRSRDRGGTGLGLAIAREIVIAHGGSIAVGDSDLGGARFVVRFPAATDGEGEGA